MADESKLSTSEEQVRRVAETLRRQLGVQFCSIMQQPEVIAVTLNAYGRWFVAVLRLLSSKP